jgi:hypothetical protein
MIIYGSRAAHLKSAQSKTAVCPGCNTKGSLVFSVYSRHAHIYWIPLFPFGKTGGVECRLCTYSAVGKQMPHDIKKEYDYLKYQTRTPFWQFAGLGILLVILSWIVFIIQTHEDKELTYIAAPMVGDVYEYQTEGKTYSTLKVIEISSDSIYLSPNIYETNKRTSTDQIDIAENYSTSVFGILINDLKSKYEEGTIYGIIRK